MKTEYVVCVVVRPIKVDDMLFESNHSIDDGVIIGAYHTPEEANSVVIDVVTTFESERAHCT